MPIRVLHIGLGPIGAAVVRQVATRPDFKAVGAIDIDAAKLGRDLGEVVGLERRLRVTVSDNLRAVVKATRPDVVVLSTSSSLKKVWPQIEAVLKLKLPIVSTTEELAYPWWNQKALSKKIDAAARKARVAVVGTGVNPGFTMDALPITLTGVCQEVTAIRVNRVQDARTRRLPFQQKIGCGLTTEQFQARVDIGTVRHVGLTESIAMIAGAMGWKLDRVTDQIQPVVSKEGISSPLLTVAPGLVCGLIQDGVGYVGGAADHHAPHGGVPRRARVVRLGGHRGHAQAGDEDRRRRARRRRDRLDHRQLHPEGDRRRTGPAHDANIAHSELGRIGKMVPGAWCSVLRAVPGAWCGVVPRAPHSAPQHRAPYRALSTWNVAHSTRHPAPGTAPSTRHQAPGTFTFPLQLPILRPEAYGLLTDHDTRFR